MPVGQRNRTAIIKARVTEDDRAWVEREAERIGLDPSSFLRMTLKRERNEREARPANIGG
jgi:antitoxin component of RelBE/YafQ-DinJ toxin-antitoxin module